MTKMKKIKPLPKAKLIDITWHKNRAWCSIMRFRCANFASLWVGKVEIVWRMPWIKRVAENLHPECFRAFSNKDQSK